MALRRTIACLGLCLLGGWPLLAAGQSTLYGYVDGAGVAHVAERPLDARYQPLLREPGDDDARVPGKTMAPAGLLIWLEFAPAVKATQPLLRRAEQATGVDAELLKALIAVESGYESERVSPRGAVGLMQITPDAARRYAPKGAAATPQDWTVRLRDPAVNVMTGARMLADLTRRYGRIDVALAAWNAGEGAVRKAGRQVPEIAETKAHVHLVLELYWALLQQRQQARARNLNLVRTGSSSSQPLALR